MFTIYLLASVFVGLASITIFWLVKKAMISKVLVQIGHGEVGVVIKQSWKKTEKAGQIALNNEAGVQADILQAGIHFKLPWTTVEIVVPVEVPDGEIGLVKAKDGLETPSGRVLGKAVECDNFQNARAFLENGGYKGLQLNILKGGKHYINTELFDVITSKNYKAQNINYNLNEDSFRPFEIPSGMCGIVTTKDGRSLVGNLIAGPIVSGHNNFENPDAFIKRGGYRGLQEQVLNNGTYWINPLFAEVEIIPEIEIQPGTVGVVISEVGEPSDEILVNEGEVGILKKVLLPGSYQMNTYIKKVIEVPTNPITLNWSDKKKPDTNYDSGLAALKVRSNDPAKPEFTLEVTQVIRIDRETAPKMIASIGVSEIGVNNNNNRSIDTKYPAIHTLLTKVLEPAINSCLRDEAQKHKAQDFHSNRDEIQYAVAKQIRNRLATHGVVSDSTVIEEVGVPQELKSLFEEHAKEDLLKQEHKNTIQKMKTRIVKARARAEAQRLLNAPYVEMLEKEVQVIGGPEKHLRREAVKQLSKMSVPSVWIGAGSPFASFLDIYNNPQILSIPQLLNQVKSQDNDILKELLNHLDNPEKFKSYVETLRDTNFFYTNGNTVER